MLYTPTTTEVEKMNRTDLVFELAKKCHIDHYHKAITMPTEMLRNLLNYYNDGNEKMVKKVIAFVVFIM